MFLHDFSQKIIFFTLTLYFQITVTCIPVFYPLPDTTCCIWQGIKDSSIIWHLDWESGIVCIKKSKFLYEDHRSRDIYKSQSWRMSARNRTGMNTCYPRPAPILQNDFQRTCRTSHGWSRIIQFGNHPFDLSAPQDYFPAEKPEISCKIFMAPGRSLGTGQPDEFTALPWSVSGHSSQASGTPSLLRKTQHFV